MPALSPFESFQKLSLKSSSLSSNGTRRRLHFAFILVLSLELETLKCDRLLLAHTHIPFFTWWKANRIQVIALFVHLRPFQSPFSSIFFKPSGHMWLRRRNIKPVWKCRKTRAVKTWTLRHIFSLRHESKSINVSRIISVLSSFGIRGLLWEHPIPSDNTGDRDMKRPYPNHFCILKPKQLYWNYGTANIGVSEAGPHTSAFLGNVWSTEYKLQCLWKRLGELMLPLWQRFLYWHHMSTFTPAIYTRNMLSLSTIAVACSLWFEKKQHNYNGCFKRCLYFK